MSRYDDRHGSTRLYVGHLSSRTRSRDLDDIFGRYGRIRDVDMKRDYAFVEFSDPRDADDARYRLNGREIDGSRITVEFAKGMPRGGGGGSYGGGYGGSGGGGSREYLGRGPAPGTGRCFNCGLDGHWARDCKAGDWKNKCYRCGERGHIEKNCKNSPQKTKRGRSYSRTPSPRRGRSRSRSFSRSRSYSRSRSPVKRDRSIEATDRRSKRSPPPSKGRKQSLSPDARSPREKGSLSPQARGHANGSEYSGSPKERSKSPAAGDVARDRSMSPAEENGRGHSSPSPVPRDNGSPIEDDDDNPGSPRGSESA